MAADFIGLTVLVKLISSPDRPLQGLVSNVQDQTLFLKNVLYPTTGQRVHEFTVHGSEIADVEVAPTVPPSTTFPHSHDTPQQTASFQAQPASDVRATPGHFVAQNDVRRPKQHPSLRPAQLPPLPQKHFVDPAILSFDRTASQIRDTTNRPGNDIISQFVSSSLRAKHEPSSQTGQTHRASRTSLPELSAYGTTPTSTTHNIASTTPNLTTPFNALGLNDDGIGDSVSGTTAVELHEENVMSRSSTIHAQEVPGNKKRQSRGRRRREQEQKESQFELEDSSPGTTRKVHAATETNLKGWRQTPISQSKHESGQQLLPESGDGQVTKGRKHRQRRQKRPNHHANQNGWATEDATDVHEMGDFDFEGNLSKFDKHAVFAQLRDEDTTADEDRLVSFNRMKRPGTFGGKNLHPSENVLERGDDDSTLESDSDEELWNGSIGSKAMERHSRNSSVRPGGLPRASSTLSERAGSGCGEAQSFSSSRSQQKHAQQSLFSGHVTGTPKSFERTSPSLQQQVRSSSCQHRPRLRYVETDRICRTVRPDILRQIEQIAISELKYSEDMLSENAGRGIAEVALAALNPGGRRLEQDQNPQPIVVMLLGNNEAGARALVSARHLQERGVRVIACTIGAVSLTSEPLSQPWQRFGDMLRGWTETAAYLKTLDAPPELIIDALIGRTTSTLDNLDPGAVADASQTPSMKIVADMIKWANRSSANVLSIDLPSGIDPVTGGDALLCPGGNPTQIRAKIVVCLGAPCTGLLKALELRVGGRGGEGRGSSNDHDHDYHDHHEQEQWRVVVADIGLNPAAKHYLRSVKASSSSSSSSTGSGKLVQFGTGWSVRLRFDPGRMHTNTTMNTNTHAAHSSSSLKRSAR